MGAVVREEEVLLDLVPEVLVLEDSDPDRGWVAQDLARLAVLASEEVLEAQGSGLDQESVQLYSTVGDTEAEAVVGLMLNLLSQFCTIPSTTDFSSTMMTRQPGTQPLMTQILSKTL